jgi:hypothetical protein
MYENIIFKRDACNEVTRETRATAVVLNKVNVDVTRKVNNAVKTLSKEAPAKVSEIVTQGVVDNKKEKLKEVINNPPRR